MVTYIFFISEEITKYCLKQQRIRTIPFKKQICCLFESSSNLQINKIGYFPLI